MEHSFARFVTFAIRRIVLGASAILMIAVPCLGQVKLNSATSPGQGQAGLNLVSVTGSGFPAGSISPSNVMVSLSPAPPAVGASATTKATAVQTIIGSTRRIQFQIPAAVAVNATTSYLVSIMGSTSTGVSFSSINTATLQVIPSPVISLNPNSGQVGSTLTVQIAVTNSAAGANAGFAQGSTVASFGAGTSVGGAGIGVLGPVTVTGQNSATAQLTISPTATAGTQNVLVETGSEELYSTFIITSPPPSRLAFTAQPQNVSSGQALPAVQVAIEDASGNVIPDATTPVTVALGANPGGDVLAGTLTENAVNGIATFPNLSLKKIGTGYTLVASSSGLTTTSNPFNVSAGSAARLLFISQPANADIGQTLGSVQVSIEDANGNLITTAASITVAIGTNPGNGTLSGTLTQTTVNGIATFADLNINQAGNGYTLAASTSNLTATSSLFNVTGAPALILVNPNTGAQGQMGLSVALTGRFTHWTQGISTASFGPEITVDSLTVNSPTTATAVIDIPSSPPGNTMVITYYTIAETDKDANKLAFGSFNNEVQSQLGPDGLPILNTAAFGCTSNCYSPNGAPTDVLPNGEITYWSPTLNNGAAGGTSDIVETGSAIVALPFSVPFNFFPPNGTGPNDANGFQAALISGTLTNASPETVSFSIGADDMAFAFLDGAKVCDLGGVHGFSPGTCVTPFTISPGTHSLEVFFVDINQVQAGLAFDVTTPDATTTGLLGPHDVTVSTNSEVVTLKNGFTVTAGTPVLTQVSPNSGLQGQQNMPVAIIGQFTHFVQGTTIASFGPGITVSSLTVNSATAATAFLNIDPSAQPGPRIVSLTTGNELVSLDNAFSVIAVPHLVFTSEPGNATSGQSVGSVQVSVEDLAGNLITTPASITIAIGTNPSAGVLSGTLTQNAIGGVATFADLSVNLPGNGYTLVASSSNLSAISSPFNVTLTQAALASCVPAGSLSVLVKDNSVTSYVPNGSWFHQNPNVQVVPIEGTGPLDTINTPNAVNSCASSSVTGETVCTANNTDVYLLRGSSLIATLTSGSTGPVSFSGGSCENCGVAIDPVNNRAVLGIGGQSNSSIQFLNLESNTFSTPIPLGPNLPVSEDIAVDPVRNVILSADENGFYEILQYGSNTALFDANVKIGSTTATLLDASAVDCTTGIALATAEETSKIFLTDLTQANFLPGSPVGSWSAPSQFQDLPELISTSNGTSAIVVAPGQHIGMVTGEFGSNLFAVFQLPATAGTGTPEITDYVTANIPPDPSGALWNFGGDPHTLTAYISPTTGKGYGVVANSYGGPPTFLAIADLQGILNAPRIATHVIDPKIDLLATGLIRFIGISPATHLVISVQPTDTPEGQAMAPAIQVLVEDTLGHVVTSSEVPITLAIGTNPSGGYLAGTLTINAVDGVATFPGLRLFGAGMGYTLVASSYGVANAISNPFNITPGPASLTFTTQPPSGVKTGELFAPATQVTVVDSQGAVATGYNGPVIISLLSNPGHAILSGTLTLNAINGVATFADLSLNTAGNGYTLQAYAAGLIATSAPFNVRVSPELASCLPSSSLGVLLPRDGTGNVTAYSPNGSWSDGHLGIQVVPVEGGGAPAVISTPNPVNSCASNSVTGETVCVANNTDVYLISGSALNNTLTSSSSGVTFQFDPAVLPAARPPKAPFLSGGWCENCGVAINGETNTAVIEMGLTTGLPPFYSALQFLDLGTNTFSAPFPLANDISEDIQWDSIHKLILSPSEYQLGDVGPDAGPAPGLNGVTGGNYDLIDTSTSIPTEFGRVLTKANFDAAAGDCTTGIALSGLEGDVPPPFQSPASRGLFISDLTQATFTAGLPGSWTAPGQFVAFPEFFYIGYFGAGTPAVAVPPGSHLAVVAGEEAGDQFGVVQLPSASGSGTPAFGDYAAAELPRTPDGQSWSQGFDPHTITAYVSPNTGRPMAIFANTAPPTWLAVIDLQGLLDAPRVTGVFPGGIGSPCPTCTHTVDPSYDLIANNVVRYIGTPPQIASVCQTTGQRGQQSQQISLTGIHTHWSQETTTASFGPGINVESLSVGDATHATAVISVDPAADLGPRTVTTATGAEVASADNPYVITALASVSPSTGGQGQQNLSVTLTGEFTNWVRGEPRGGITQLNFGAGIVVTSVTVNSPTSLTATLNIDPSAPTGPRPVTINIVTSGCDTQTFSSAFTVTAGAQILESVNPSTGQKGQQNLSVALVGSGTNWVQGTTTADFGPEITVTSLTVNSPTSATAVLNISPGAGDGPQTVTVTTGSEVETRVNGFVVSSTVNPLLLIEPNIGQQGQQNLSVFIADNFGSYWVPGLTNVSFGDGITVTSLTVSAAYAATAVLNISPTADIGPRTVTLTTGSEIDTMVNGFAVTPGTNGIPGSPAQLAFITQPITTEAGQTISAVRVAVEDASGNLIPGATNAVTVSIGQNSSAGTLAGTTVAGPVNGLANFLDLAINKVGAYTLLASSPGLASATSSPFSITPGPATQLSFTTLPSVVNAGQSSLIQVAVEDQFGNIVSGATNQVALALGTNPGGATLTGTTSAASSSGTASFSVSINKNGSGYSFTASSPGLTSASSGSFVVNPGAPTQLAFLTQPISFALNATMNTVQVAVEDSSGNVVSTTSGTVSIALSQNPSGATLSGILSAPLVNGVATFSGLSIDKVAKGYSLAASSAGFVAISNSFDVLTFTGPSIISLTPGMALQGTSLQVTITAAGTHFVQGTTTADFGPGISIASGLSGRFGPVQVLSATTAIAQVNVAGNATPAVRTVVVQTGSEQASLVNGFAVNGNPFLTYVSPSFGQPGQIVSVTIKGVFTNFQQGVTQASFGPGISVGGAAEGTFGPVVITDPVTATAQLAINAAASPGLRPVTLQTGAEQASLQNNGFLVLGTVTGPFPTVSIDSPTEGAEITSPTTVTGTVISPNLASWTLDYQASDSTTFTTIATGSSSAVTGTFDPTLLLNGIATIRLTAVDDSGQTTSTQINVAVARKLKVGIFTVSFNDLTIPVAGIPIQITRTYDSRFKGVGDFGFGWTLSIKSLKVSVNGRLGMNWQGSTQGSVLIPVYCIMPAQNHLVTIRLPGDTLYQFQPVLTAGVVDFAGDTQPGCQWFEPLQTLDVTFVPIGATPSNAKLTAINGEALFVNGTFPGIGNAPADIQLLDDVTGEAFDPDQFQLTLATGQTFLVSRTFGVQSVTDTNNNTLTITNAGITSSTGKGIGFTRDAQNRIATITDPMGNTLSYSYDGNGDLATFTDQLKNISTFTYDSVHDLLSYKDPRGVQPLENVYDDSGRLIQQINASGQVQNFSNDIVASTQAFTDFLGNTTSYIYDSHGNVIQQTDPLGNVTSRTFDANDNLLTETNPLGKTTTYTYDAANNTLSKTDPLGHTTRLTYNSHNEALTITDPNGNTTTNVYDSNGNLLTSTDPLGHTTTKTYDNSGNLTSITDADGHKQSFALDIYGNIANSTDAAGVVKSYTYDFNGNRLSQAVTRTTSSGQQVLTTTFQYDANNHLLSTVFPDGSTTQTIYNAIGEPAARIDELGRRTTYMYDATGKLLQATFADGASESHTYDADGRPLTFTATSGAVTSYSYDAAGNQITSTDALGGTIATSYDAAGRPVTKTDAAGNSSHIIYDDTGHVIQITDAFGNARTGTYDAADRQLSITDPNGHTTNYQYDANGRRIVTVFSDGTVRTKTYDTASRITSEIDQAGHSTQFAYDAVGRLVRVIDALKGSTTYSYDEVGNRTSQIDANGHITLFAYDERGRQVARTLPGGQSEHFLYDAAGELLSHVDFNGRTTTYTYDSAGRLTSKIPDPSFHAPTVTYSYDGSGRRASMTDASGITTYNYDGLGRLTSKRSPEGNISYTYDSLGHVVKLQTDAQTVTYTYDTLNRLSSVAEPTTGTTSYAYDAAGNLQNVLYPNGIVHTFNYDPVNQLKTLTVNKDSLAVASYSYTLDSSGHRLSIAELGGRIVTYTYDAVYHLETESISGSSTGSNGTVTYTYDPVGNRIQTTSALSGISSGSSGYDADDRLNTDTYDAEGNTTLSDGVGNTYDFENRLIQHGGSTITYDGDGNRVQETTGGITKTYLVDDLNVTGSPQVIAENSSDGSSRTYVYGLQRINQTLHAPGSGQEAISFYLYDGHGSVRALADTSGGITDTYDYDAFGNLINRTGTTVNDYLFAGEEFDPALGIYYNRARYYDQREGRFWTMDTFNGIDTSPASLHKYLYASADPVDRSDPSGNQDLLEEDAAVSIQGELASQSVFYNGFLRGAVTGGVLGCIGGAISQDSTCEEGAIDGALSGALFGAAGAAYGATAFGASTAGKLLFVVAATGLAGSAAYDAFRRGDYALAAFDVVTFLGGFYFATLSTPGEPLIRGSGRAAPGPLPPALQEAVTGLNPTGCTTNCFTVAEILDDVFAGGPKRAAPWSNGEPLKEFQRIDDGWTLNSLESIVSEVEANGAGSRGIVVGVPQDPKIDDIHAFNVVNYEGSVFLLDGQIGGIASTGRFDYFLFFRTNFGPN